MHKFQDTRDLPLLDDESDSIVLFRPHIPKGALDEIGETLESRWIGQGPRVARFEEELVDRQGIPYPAVAVGAGTDALHLAYILSNIGPGDEVICPVFTCTATNIPLLYQQAKLRFADVQPGTLNIDPNHVRMLVSDRTKAIVCVSYGGVPCDMDQLSDIAAEAGVPLIEDAAHSLGATYRGRPCGTLADFTIFSFQAIKLLTTGDGGMLILRDKDLLEKCRRLRWFGIDRSAKQGGYWENDIREVGYKYQMTDISAAIGLAGLREYDEVLRHRRRLLEAYRQGLQGIDGLRFIGCQSDDRESAAWLCTVDVDRRRGLERKLREHRVESGQVHFRNDRYSIFARFREGELPNMNAMENRYLVLPMHTHLSTAHIGRVCEIIRSGW